MRSRIVDYELFAVPPRWPFLRLGTPADVAGVVAFLASVDAAFVTGASLLVDGGRSQVMQDDTLPEYRTRRAEGP